MKVVILAGGFGTRLAEETEIKPKPMVEIGGRPILWHILKHYAHYGFKEFLVALGYKGEVIKRFFLDYPRLNGSLTIDLTSGQVEIYDKTNEDWRVHLIETGLYTNTGSRVKRLQSWLGNETFMLTYGDGLSDIDLPALLRFHHFHQKIATITAVRPPARFGGLTFNGELVAEFSEKPQIEAGWINGGFMVFEPAIFDYLEGHNISLEADALSQLAVEGQLVAYQHKQFWQCMDTLREVHLLERLWQGEHPPWKVWPE
jgi:glucose-1-phosphate cytidylyltransferase